MSKRSTSNSRPVYSTEVGRLCPQCQRGVAQCVCKTAAPADNGDGIVRLRRETKGRGGKAVTIISGIPLSGAALKTLAKELKQKCGVGGAIKDMEIEIQGDQRPLLLGELEKRGYKVKLSGG